MFHAKRAAPLFPTTLWTFELPTDAHGRMNAVLRNKFDQLIAAAPRQNHKGTRQTAHDLHTLPEMQELKGYFMNAVHQVMSALSTKYKDVEITGCWANFGPPGGSHNSHTHPNNFLSAVYYVTVPPGANRINFHDPRHQSYILRSPVEQGNEHNAEYAEVTVKEGTLILFPSWLVHSVPANTGNECRVSISFNINFKNFTGLLSPPNWEFDVPTHPKPL